MSLFKNTIGHLQADEGTALPIRLDSYKERAINGKLHLFSIYRDWGAYRRIKWTVNAIAKLAGEHWQCSSEMWNLDSSMAGELMREMLASDGANADVLVVVIGSLEQRTPEMIEWLDSLMPLGPDRTGLLIGLLGDEENKAQELDWTAKELIRCARKTNRKFIWNWMGRDAMEDPDWLRGSVELLLARKSVATSVLQEAAGHINATATWEFSHISGIAQVVATENIRLDKELPAIEPN
ncbi:MAG TPA: hypothetical protein VK811_01615 [Candidatus Acidoferrum sp.]|nr:hypothetical protein [Candidatus Acidoferrum sp.]